jgi:hypothetical protein
MVRPHALTLLLALAACKGGSEGPSPATPSASFQPAPRASDAAVAAVQAPAFPPREVPSGPLATHTEVQFRMPWVVLGQNVVDVTTGRRVRTLPFGEVRFADDGQHLVVYDGHALRFGAVREPGEDLTLVATLDGLWRLQLAPSGGAAIFWERDETTVVVDVRARTETVVARRQVDGAPPDPREGAHGVSSDGRRATWVDGDVARVRELDTTKTRDLRANGKVARRSEIAGDTWVALFEDELVVARLSSGATLFRQSQVGGFVLADDGKTVAWEDATAALQSIGLFDVGLGRTRTTTTIEDDPAGPRRYAGVCGGGHFEMAPPYARLVGTTLSVHRSCSLVDEAQIDLGGSALIGMDSFTPADDFEDEKQRTAACHRARAACGSDAAGRGPRVVWLPGQRRALMNGARGGIAVFEVATGRRVATLASAEDVRLDVDLRVAPDGKTIAAIDDRSVAWLWDAATGKVLWSGPAGAP